MMNQLLPIAMLLILAPQNQRLPAAFYELPEQDRKQATLVFTGTYGEGRSPCIIMPDGTRRWALESWFRISKVYRGRVGGKFIHTNRTGVQKSKAVSIKLVTGHKYLVLLRPNKESMKAIRAGGYVPAWDALHDEEILAIVELR